MGEISHGWVSRTRQIPCPPPLTTPFIPHDTWSGGSRIAVTHCTHMKRTGTCRLSSSNKMRPIWLYSITYVTSHWISQLRVGFLSYPQLLLCMHIYTHTHINPFHFFNNEKKKFKNGNTVDDLAKQLATSKLPTAEKGVSYDAEYLFEFGDDYCVCFFLHQNQIGARFQNASKAITMWLSAACFAGKTAASHPNNIAVDSSQWRTWFPGFLCAISGRRKLYV